MDNFFVLIFIYIKFEKSKVLISYHFHFFASFITFLIIFI